MTVKVGHAPMRARRFLGASRNLVRREPAIATVRAISIVEDDEFRTSGDTQNRPVVDT